ncbi:unnamed protein product [Mycena citricolor]|uniref:Uncharacterized protein n=1 Tax=Mycena citricolor TaxID=2018698 RepID=A0AAD2JVA3_9AGAR|nr:unnamed protein product [Mycena citricolor]CAK5278784.1 unnamed protein product [Mycena citricolor]
MRPEFNELGLELGAQALNELRFGLALTLVAPRVRRGHVVEAFAIEDVVVRRSACCVPRDVQRTKRRAVVGRLAPNIVHTLRLAKFPEVLCVCCFRTTGMQMQTRACSPGEQS